MHALNICWYSEVLINRQVIEVIYYLLAVYDIVAVRRGRVKLDIIYRDPLTG